MTFAQLDHIADLYIPLFGLALLILALSSLARKHVTLQFVLSFVIRSVVAVALAQQSSKFMQKKHILGVWGEHFPSTHFAVALALATCMVVLNRRLWPVALGFTLAYGALMLYQHYHTPIEMLGALYAIPLALLFHWKGNRKTAIASN